MEDFIISVIKLREAQKACLRKRNKDTLQNQFFWEMTVDNHCKNLIKNIARTDIMKESLHKIFK